MYILFYALAVIIWGTDAAITKRFLSSSIDPAPMLALRFSMAALTLLPFAVKDFPLLKKFRRKEWIQLVVLILVGTLGMNLLYYEGLRQTPAFITLILYRVEPVFIILMSTVFLHQKSGPRTWLLTISGITCAALVSAGGVSNFSMSSLTGWGVALVVMASIFSAVSNLVAKDLLGVIAPNLLTALRTGLTAIILLAWTGKDIAANVLPALTTNDILLIVFLGSVYSGIGFWMYYKGLQATSPLIGSLVNLLRIVSGLGASYVFLNESPNLIQWLGTAGLMVSLYLLTRPSPMKVQQDIRPAVHSAQ